MHAGAGCLNYQIAVTSDYRYRALFERGPGAAELQGQDLCSFRRAVEDTRVHTQTTQSVGDRPRGSTRAYYRRRHRADLLLAAGDIEKRIGEARHIRIRPAETPCNRQ